MHFAARARGVGLGLAVNLVVVQVAQAGPVVPAPVVPGPTNPPVSSATGATSVSPPAEAAHREGEALLRQAKYSEAVARLDHAISLAPSWSAPVRLRAEAFGALAERYAPSEAFFNAQAADIQLLLRLEPGVDVAVRQQKLLELHRAAAAAKQREAKHRKLAKPAVIYIALNISMLVSGAFMTAFHAAYAAPDGSLDAYGQKRYVYTGAVMLGIGGAMIPGSIALGVLAGRQHRRDSAVADLNVETGRRGPELGVAPQVLPGGGGLGLRLRF